MLLFFLALIIGIFFLWYGADFLVRGTSAIASNLDIDPIVIGIIISIGTTIPELLVSVFAVLQGNADIALGNVVGSNIANIGLILGVSGMITTLSVERHIMHKEFPFILFAPIVLFTLAFDGILTRSDGFILIFIAIIFYSLFIKRMHDGKFKHILEEITEEAIHKKKTYIRHCLSIFGGLAGIIIGAKLTVDGASAVARGIHIPEIIIGVSLVAVGTSLPELVTSVSAAIKKNRQLSLGNILGSNVLNIFVILGIVVLVHPITVPYSMLWFHIPAMFIFSLLLFISLLNYRKLQRRDAIILFILYIMYIGYSFYKFHGQTL